MRATGNATCASRRRPRRPPRHATARPRASEEHPNTHTRTGFNIQRQRGYAAVYSITLHYIIYIIHIRILDKLYTSFAHIHRMHYMICRARTPIPTAQFRPRDCAPRAVEGTHEIPTGYPRGTHGVPTGYPRGTHGVPTGCSRGTRAMAHLGKERARVVELGLGACAATHRKPKPTGRLKG